MMAGGCELIYQLRSLFDQNNSANNWIEAAGECFLPNSTTPRNRLDTQNEDDYETVDYGKLLYAFITPIIFFVGLIGNLISLRVFFSRTLRRLSASVYLAAISISDLMVLIINVLLEWLRKGLPHFPGGKTIDWINISGVCESFLYFSYLFRFVSVWLIVVFTVERYIAACRPLQRRAICTKGFGRRAIMVVFFIASLVSLFKPIINGVYPKTLEDNGYGLGHNDSHTQAMICTFHPDYAQINFILEVAFGLSITALPFLVIALFNSLILRTLMQRDANIKKWKLNFKDSRIRWEFTVTLLVVSSTFVCLNLPYFIVWCQRFLLSTTDTNEAALKTIHTVDQHYITRTIFYINYCINFFLYCLTGTYYRRELWLIFCCSHEGYVYTYAARGSVISCTTNTTHIREMSKL